jgi:hypothetical protein
MQFRHQGVKIMINVLNYPVPTAKRHEEAFLFGLMGLLVVIGILYYALYFALGHVTQPSSQIEEVPKIKTIVV